VARAVRATTVDPPPPLAVALDALEADGATARWNDLVAALHAARGSLGEPEFADALATVRLALRARLDRALRYAR
jgi:hypothetical protein